MNASLHRHLNRRKRRILRRIENQPGVERHRPMMAASNIHYEIADRVRGIAPGGIGAIHLLARKLGLVEDIDRALHLLKRHLPYHESDHVLNIAYTGLPCRRRRLDEKPLSDAPAPSSGRSGVVERQDLTGATAQ